MAKKVEDRICVFPAMGYREKFLWTWLNFAEKHPFIYFGGCFIVFGLWIALSSLWIGS